MRLTLRATKLNNTYSIIEYKNDARKDYTIPKYEYWIWSDNKRHYVFGCNSRFDSNDIINLYHNGYFDSFMEA